MAWDRLQLKANGRSVEGARLHNGELVLVSRIDKTGTLVVIDERGATKSLAPSQRLFVRGYAVTSYASQGKTVDTVIVADSGNRSATSAQQWYVGISRARKHVVVLTPDKAALRENIQRSGERELALREELKQQVTEQIGGPNRSQRTKETLDRVREHQAFTEQLKRSQNARQNL